MESQKSILLLIADPASMTGWVPDILKNSCSNPACTGFQDNPESGGVGSPNLAKFVHKAIMTSLTAASFSDKVSNKGCPSNPIGSKR